MSKNIKLITLKSCNWLDVTTNRPRSSSISANHFQFSILDKRSKCQCLGLVLCMRMCVFVCDFCQYKEVSYPRFPGIWAAVCPRASVRGIIRHLTSYSAN